LTSITANTLGISPTPADRRWAYARASIATACLLLATPVRVPLPREIVRSDASVRQVIGPQTTDLISRFVK
jgi:hypothetical protein